MMRKCWVLFFLLFSVQIATADSVVGGGIVEVIEKQVGSSVSLSGTVIPKREVTLAAQLPGRVRYLAGKEGDAFAAKTLLVAIDETELLAKYNSARANLAKADAAFRNASMQYTRELHSPQQNTGMTGMGVPSMFDNMFSKPASSMMGTNQPGLDRQAQLYAQGTQIEQAKSAIEQAKAQVRAIESKLRDAKSMAPFNGLITSKFVEVGDTVQPGQPLLKFANTQELQVLVNVPARLMSGISQGMTVPAKLDISPNEIMISVDQIFPIAQSDSHTVAVKFNISTSTGALPGMYVEVRVPDVNSEVKSVPLIPVSAIKWRGSLPGVYVINSENKAELRLIRVGEKYGRDQITVLSGLKAGERIMANPSGRVLPSNHSQ